MAFASALACRPALSDPVAVSAASAASVASAVAVAPILPAASSASSTSSATTAAAQARPGPPAADAADEAPSTSATASASAPASAPAPRLPLAAFADLPFIESAQLSPDGRHVAALLNHDGDTLLVTSPLRPLALKPLMRTDNRGQQFGWVHWVGNDRLLVGARAADERNGNDTVETRLLSVPVDGSGATNLIHGSVFDQGPRLGQFQDQVVDWLPEDGRHVLVALPQSDSGGIATGVARVDVQDGSRTMVKSPGRDVLTWITDATHRVRVGVRQHGAEFGVMVCDADGGHWRTAWTYTAFENDAVVPLGFGTDPNLLYIQADAAGRRAVYTVDLRDPALPRTLVLADAHADLTGELLHDPRTGEAVGVAGGFIAHGDRLFWNADVRTLAEQIDLALPNRANRLMQLGLDGDHYLVHSSGNGIAPEWYVGSRASGTMGLLAQTYPGLPPAELATKHLVTITARDGLRLHAYLTLPKGVAPRQLPAVLLPHGGPQAGDHTGFDLWSAFLANRGYAVLQVNFRGSVGEGQALMSAGLRRWGLEMQDDLTDAVHWLVARGTADPKRIAIVGGSYGGYAALMGAVKTPELYRAVVSFAGIGDLVDMARHEGHYINGDEVFSRQVGSTWSDADRLRATSPRRFAANVQAPVLLIHGTLDRSVPLSQSEDMADALKAAGKRVRFVRQKDGDHHLSSQAQRTEFFRELEAFLDKELAP